MDRLEPDFVLAALAFGSGIHGAAAFLFRGIAAGERPTVADVHSYFESFWSRETTARPVRFAEKDSRASLLDLAVRMLAVLYENLQLCHRLSLGRESGEYGGASGAPPRWPVMSGRAGPIEARARPPGATRAWPPRPVASRPPLMMATLSRLESVREEAAKAAAASRIDLAAAAGSAAEQDADAGLEAGHRSALAPLRLPDGMPDQPSLDGARRRVEQSVTERLRAVEHVRRLVAAVETATTELPMAKRTCTELTAQLDEAIGAERDAHDVLARRQLELVRDYRAWAGSVTELLPDDPDHIAEELDEWSRATEGPSPAATAVRQALDDAVQRLAAGRADVERRRVAVTEHLDGLRLEQRRLAEGHHLPPPPPHTRDDAGRAGREGAPLWLLCDFHPAVDEAARAGLEAALEPRASSTRGSRRMGRFCRPASTTPSSSLPRAPSPRPMPTSAPGSCPRSTAMTRGRPG